METSLLSRREWLVWQGLGTTALILSPTPRSNGLAARELSPAKKGLIPRQEKPFNAEPQLSQLIQGFITPVDQFFVRSHGTVPEIDPANYRFEVGGMVEQPLGVALSDLKKFPEFSLTATVTCAGNRRSEFAAEKKVAGVQWDAGAIGNAEWTGVRLADVLKTSLPKPSATHVWFDGLDEVEAHGEKMAFGASIPLERAMKPDFPVLLVTRMNGQPLLPEHGFPLRVVVPSYIGARSVKWLGKITLADRPSPNHYVQDVYKIVPDESHETAAKANPIHEYILNSVICSPSANATLKPGPQVVRGFALSNGHAGRSLQRIEVSADQGASWHLAKTVSPIRPNCWELWNAEVAVTATTTSLMVRATDSAGETQPRRTPWNAKGYQFNGWHSIPVKVE